MRRFYLALWMLTISACGLGPSELSDPVPVTSEPVSTERIVEPPQATNETDNELAEEEGAVRVNILPDPTTATWELVVSEFSKPLLLTHAGDDRLFIVEQEGLVWIIENGQKYQEPFLDIRDQVGTDGNERGLLGLAFHPNYEQDGRLFVNYTNLNGRTIISSFLVSEDPNKTENTSEQVILEIPQPFSNHNGGALNFGADGYLYIGTGDGGSGGDPNNYGQSLGILLGKLLRIDIDTGAPYSIPDDNPFAKQDGLDEIWAYGLRNPWRIAFDPLTGDLFMGDVGQNSIEEVNFQPGDSPGGENYGWNIMEGSQTFREGDQSELTLPVAEYDHSQGCSITGGVVVRDPQLPDWDGVYLYGDYCTGIIWGLTRDAQGAWIHEKLYESGVRISSFGTDSLDRVYLVDHGGKIYRLDPIGGR